VIINILNLLSFYSLIYIVKAKDMSTTPSNKSEVLFIFKKSNYEINILVKKLFCYFCGKIFIYISNLRCHEKTHTSVNRYQCQKLECLKTFKTIRGFKHHVISHDKDKIPFICRYGSCGKGYFSKSRLESHFKIHVK
jgi:hypothetical protein